MSKTEQQITSRSLPPTRDNDLSATTYQFIKEKLERKFWTDVDIFLQGSYANSTNIKKDSDIDIVICYKSSVFNNIDNLSESEKNLFNSNRVPATYKFYNFKNDVEVYLKSIFWNLVERKNKCITIKWSWTRVDTDVIPCFIHKRYSSYNVVSAIWIEFRTDKGESVVSFPKQHKTNWEQKNQNTWWNFKSLVRVVKNCKKELVAQSIITEDLVSSFLLECLFWNISNSIFSSKYTLKDNFNVVISKIYDDMWNKEIYDKYAEVCDLFYLLRLWRTKSSPSDIKIFLEKVYQLINN